MTKPASSSIKPIWCVLFVTLLWAVIFGVRLIGPATLTDDDQERPAAYILDVVKNGHWIVQVDDTGDVTSKPPLYTWIAAVFSIAWGRLDFFTLYLPCALAVLGVAWMVLALGWRHDNPLTGLLAATIYLLSLPSFLLVGLARTDPVFVFMTVASALLLWRLWETGRGALPFWIVATLATLTKGPLGLLLALGGLLAIAWERKRPGPGEKPAGVLAQPWGHAIGLLIYFGVCLGWLYLAKLQLGDAVTDKLIDAELAGHATRADDSGAPFTNFYQPTPWLVLRFLPWTIPAVIGIWQAIRQPATNPTRRRLERFLIAYLLFGLTVFSIAPHQRHLHLSPLYFVMALMAGRVIANWADARRWRPVAWRHAIAAMLIAAVCTAGYNTSRMADQKRRDTRDYFALANLAEETLGSSLNVAILDSTFSFQFPGNTHVQRINSHDALTILCSGLPAFVAVSRWGDFQASFGDVETPTLYRYGVTPDADFGTDPVEIVSNHPRFEIPPYIITFVNNIGLVMHGVVLLDAGPGNLLRFHAVQPEGRIEFIEHDDPAITVRYQIVNGTDPSVQTIDLTRWEWGAVTFTAPVDKAGPPPRKTHSPVRRALFLVGVLLPILAIGATITTRALVRRDTK